MNNNQSYSMMTLSIFILVFILLPSCIKDESLRLILKEPDVSCALPGYINDTPAQHTKNINYKQVTTKEVRAESYPAK